MHFNKREGREKARADTARYVPEAESEFRAVAIAFAGRFVYPDKHDPLARVKEAE
jgi:hypothetical protein